MKNIYKFEKTTTFGAMNIIKDHVVTLASPLDSWCEDTIFESNVYLINFEGSIIGYMAIKDRELFSFYVDKLHYNFAPDILEDLLKQMDISQIYTKTNDPLLMGLIMEWDYELKDRDACFFCDSNKKDMPIAMISGATFRTAVNSDIEYIIRCTGDFFDKHDERVKDETIFMLEYGGKLLGCGTIEMGRICTTCASIGMITLEEHRRKGVAQTVLWHLKEWAYARGLRPVAGCWYYNTLSRKSLEAAGMIAAGKGSRIVLKRKEQLPMRTED